MTCATVEMAFYFVDAIIYSVLIIGCFLLYITPVHAYIDPSVMTYAIQAIAGMVIGLGAFFSVYWRSAKRKISKKYNINDKNVVKETNAIYFDDPVDASRKAPMVVAEEESNNEDIQKESKPTFRTGMILTFAGAFMLGVFAPLEYYFNNILEFEYDIYNLFPIILMLFGSFMLLGLIVFGVCKLISDKFYLGSLVFVFWIYICAYIQGTFLIGNLPAMDGEYIDWSQFKTDYIISIVMWIVVGIVLVLLCKFITLKRSETIIKYVSTFITAVLFVTLIVLCVNNNGLINKDDYIATTDEEFTYSTDENFIIFILDAVDSQTFRSELEKHEEWEEVLEDFTYYPNTTSAYPFTVYAIPQLLTDKWWECKGDFTEFTLDGLKTSPLLKTLEEDEYKMGLYEAYIRYDKECEGRFENIKECPYKFTTYFHALKKQIKLIWFKYMPYPVKRYVNIKVNDFNEIRKIQNDLNEFEYWDDVFYNHMLNEEIKTIDNKCFRFIHIEGAHVPTRYDENVNPINEEDGTYEMMIGCAMTITKEYLEKLKEAGVYDNSGIFIMADHGYQNNRGASAINRSNALLLVKGKDEKHDLLIDEAPISYADLQDAYKRVIDGKQGDEVFDAKEGDKRERRFLWHRWNLTKHLVEYMQTGYATDTSTLVETGNIYDYSKK